MEKIQQQQNWREKHSTLSGQLWYMYQNRIKTDIELYVSNGQKNQTYHCHKIVIMRLSSVFEKLIYQESGICEVINLSAIRPELFGQVVKFAYTDELKIKSAEDALDLIKLSKLYDVTNLKAIALRYLSNCVNTDSVWTILDFLSELNKKEKVFLTKKIDAALTEQTGACLESEKFLNCKQSSLLYLLSKDVLSVDSELPILYATLRWAQRWNFGANLTPEKTKELLGPCLSLIRFLSLTPTEFSENVAKSGLLSESDTLLALVSITTNDQNNVPEWMSKNRSARGTPAQKECQPQAPSTSSRQTPVPPQQGKQRQFKRQPANFNKNTAKANLMSQPTKLTKKPFNKSATDLSVPQLSIKSRKIEIDRLDGKSNMSIVQFAVDKETFLFSVQLLLTVGMEKKYGIEASSLRVKVSEWKGDVLDTIDFPQAIFPAWVTLRKPLTLAPTSDYLVVVYTPQSFSFVGIKMMNIDHMNHTLQIFL